MAEEIAYKTVLDKLTWLLDDLIDKDPDHAERLISSWLANVQLRRRLALHKVVAEVDVAKEPQCANSKPCQPPYCEVNNCSHPGFYDAR